MKRMLLYLMFACGLHAANDLRLPPYKRTVLPNGATLLMMERHQVPIVSFTVALKSGTTQDPKGKEGLAGITNDLLRKGTKTRTADQIAEQLDFIGGTLSSNAGPDSLRVSAEFLKKDLDKGLALFADVVRNANFDAKEVAKLLKQRVDQIRSSKDQAGAVIGPYFNAFLYGQHPYGRAANGDERTVPAITRDDIVSYYAQYYVSENMVIAVAGDFTTADMEKRLIDQFGSMPKKAPPAFNVAAPAESTGRRLLLVDKPDSTQTFFRFGNVGVARTNPDRVALDIVNTVFGGRFTSMINSALRINSGLTYGASSTFDRRRERGPFYINTYTRNATTEKAMDMALEVLKGLHEKGLTEEQLHSAKAYIKGQYGPRIETTDQLTSVIADFEIYGLTDAEVNEYTSRVDAVTMGDVRRIIQKYYPLDNLAFVVIGKASEIGELMKKYAPTIETRSISEPGYGK